MSILTFTSSLCCNPIGCFSIQGNSSDGLKRLPTPGPLVPGSFSWVRNQLTHHLLGKTILSWCLTQPWNSSLSHCPVSFSSKNLEISKMILLAYLSVPYLSLVEPKFHTDRIFEYLLISSPAERIMLRTL